MEKYRKFEDPTNGINPFIPESVKSRSFILKLAYCFQLIFGLTKAFVFVSLYILFVLLQIMRNILVIGKLKRIVEYVLCKVFGRIFLVLLGVWNINEKLGKIDKKRIPNIFISSQSSVIDWMILLYRHAPKFLWIVKSSDNKSDLFIELSYLQILFYSIGLKFITTRNNYNSFDITSYIETDSQIPLVIFPENTKTNRKGVLSIRSNLMDKLYSLVNEHGKLLLRSEIIVKGRSPYFCLSNTTDVLGLRYLIHTCSQVYNNVEVVVQDIPNDNFDRDNIKTNSKVVTPEEYCDSNLQSFLVEPNSRNIVSLDRNSHLSFLDYFNQTNKDASYVLKGEKEQ